MERNLWMYSQLSYFSLKIHPKNLKIMKLGDISMGLKDRTVSIGHLGRILSFITLISIINNDS